MPARCSSSPASIEASWNGRDPPENPAGDIGITAIMGRHEGCSIDHRCPHVSQQFFGSLPSPTAVTLRKLDRLARSIRDLRVLADAIAAKGVALQAGGQAYDPSSPMGRMFFSLLATFAEFESDLIRERTKEGMAIARAKGRLRGRAPKLKPAQEAHALALLDAGEQTPPEVAELFGVSRTTLYRAKERREARGLASVEAILPGVEVD